MNTITIDAALRADLRDAMFHPDYMLELLNWEACEHQCLVASSDFSKMERMGYHYHANAHEQ